MQLCQFLIRRFSYFNFYVSFGAFHLQGHANFFSNLNWVGKNMVKSACALFSCRWLKRRWKWSRAAGKKHITECRKKFLLQGREFHQNQSNGLLGWSRLSDHLIIEYMAVLQRQSYPTITWWIIYSLACNTLSTPAVFIHYCTLHCCLARGSLKRCFYQPYGQVKCIPCSHCLIWETHPTYVIADKHFKSCSMDQSCFWLVLQRVPWGPFHWKDKDISVSKFGKQTSERLEKISKGGSLLQQHEDPEHSSDHQCTIDKRTSSRSTRWWFYHCLCSH